MQKHHKASKQEVSLVDFVAKANELVHSDYRGFIDYCNAHSFEDAFPLVGDPFKSDYRAKVLANYQSLTGVEQYQPNEHELARFDRVDATVSEQFPFSSRDTAAVGRYIAGIGNLIAMLNLPAGSRILEYGTGWGHLAMMLGRLGMDVTCVDIEPGFVDLVNRQARAENLKVAAFRGEFGERPDGSDAVDCVIFFEAFHHSLTHLEVVQKVYDMLRPGGRLYLVGEAIYPWFPVPWGLRMDGHAVWAIRNFKWMELGFSEDYMIRLLMRCGFEVSKSANDAIGPLGLVYVGTKGDGRVRLEHTLLPTDEAATWSIATGVEWMGQRGSSMPIADLAGWTKFDVTVANDLSVPVRVSFCVGEQRYVDVIDGHSDKNIAFSIAMHSGPFVIDDIVVLRGLDGGGTEQVTPSIRITRIQYA